MLAKTMLQKKAKTLNGGEKQDVHKETNCASHTVSSSKHLLRGRRSAEAQQGGY